jgi:hypothetical protein
MITATNNIVAREGMACFIPIAVDQAIAHHAGRNRKKLTSAYVPTAKSR